MHCDMKTSLRDALLRFEIICTSFFSIKIAHKIDLLNFTPPIRHYFEVIPAYTSLVYYNTDNNDVTMNNNSNNNNNSSDEDEDDAVRLQQVEQQRAAAAAAVAETQKEERPAERVKENLPTNSSLLTVKAANKGRDGISLGGESFTIWQIGSDCIPDNTQREALILDLVTQMRQHKMQCKTVDNEHQLALNEHQVRVMELSHRFAMELKRFDAETNAAVAAAAAAAAGPATAAVATAAGEEAGSPPPAVVE